MVSKRLSFYASFQNRFYASNFFFLIFLLFVGPIWSDFCHLASVYTDYHQQNTFNTLFQVVWQFVARNEYTTALSALFIVGKLRSQHCIGFNCTNCYSEDLSTDAAVCGFEKQKQVIKLTLWFTFYRPGPKSGAQMSDLVINSFLKNRKLFTNIRTDVSWSFNTKICFY